MVHSTGNSLSGKVLPLVSLIDVSPVFASTMALLAVLVIDKIEDSEEATFFLKVIELGRVPLRVAGRLPCRYPNVAGK